MTGDATGNSALPTLDLAAANCPETAAAFRERLREVAHEVGFFGLVGHGIDPALAARVLRTARQFFALPDPAKHAIENLRSPHFRGYTRLGGELTYGARDWREQLDIGPEEEPVRASADAPWLVLRGPNQWPGGVPEFRPTLEQWYRAVTVVARRLLREWAIALDQPSTVFDAAFADAASLVKVIRYPGRAADESRQGVGGHKDVGMLTLLLLEPGAPGLQVDRDGTWVDVAGAPDTLVVNIGELLEVATAGYLRATRHRVVSPPAGRDRIAVPFFFNPGLSQEIPRLHLPPALAAKASGITDDENNPLHPVYGANALKSRLRAHPDVAALHHPQLLAAAR